MLVLRVETPTIWSHSQTDFSVDKRLCDGVCLRQTIVIRTRGFGNTIAVDLGQAIFWAPVDVLSSPSEPEWQSRPGNRALAVHVVDWEIIL